MRVCVVGGGHTNIVIGNVYNSHQPPISESHHDTRTVDLDIPSSSSSSSSKQHTVHELLPLIVSMLLHIMTITQLSCQRRLHYSCVVWLSTTVSCDSIV